MTPSVWSDHIKIAIKCWSRMRARQVAEKASQIPSDEMERFLTELLSDALLEFNATYNKASDEYIEQVTRTLDELGVRTPTVFRVERK